MIEQATFWDTYWWIIPLAMMFFCFFGMRRWFWSIESDEEVRGGCWWPRWDDSTSALEILNRRYARGEIEREEYEQKRRDILRDQISDS